MTIQQRAGAAPFDGIICIGGEDWWYHNRGHFDFQIMRRLAKSMPVLFVNSLAVRMPSIAEKGQFAGRIGRKLKSLSRGLVRVENDFWVVSPFAVPGPTGQKLAGWALAPQIEWAGRRAGIRNPLLWIHCPAGAQLIDQIPHAALVLQRTDRFEAFPEADPEIVGEQIARLKSAAELVVYCNRELMAEEQGEVRSQTLTTHGVELDAFIAAGDAQSAAPADIQHLKRPRVGFIGGIDAHTFAPELFVETTRRLPELDFILVGGCSLPDGWCRSPNVTMVGRKPYDEVARYMAAMDVLIMPWNDSRWIQACNPIKLKEYLAVGRPVVTTDFPALAPYRDLVRIAATPDAFAQQIATALETPIDRELTRARIATESWDAKAEQLLAVLSTINQPASGRRATSRAA